MNSYWNRPGDTRECECCDGMARLEIQEHDYLYGHGDDQVTLKVKTPVWVCDSCRSIFAAEGAEEAQHAAICEHLGRLTPSEISKARQAANLTQAQLADDLGISRVTVARWETSKHLQTAAHDKGMRAVFESRRAVPKQAPTPVFRTDVSARQMAAEHFDLAA